MDIDYFQYSAVFWEELMAVMRATRVDLLLKIEESMIGDEEGRDFFNDGFGKYPLS